MAKIAAALLLLFFPFCNQAQTLSVYFDTDKSTIKKTEELDSLAQTINRKKETIRIECHCDNRADSTYNYHLSMRRAERVSNYLLDKGLQSEILLRGFGKDNPAFANTPDQRFKNRRCDVIILTKKEEKITETVANKTIDIQSVKTVDLTPGTRLVLNGLEFVGNQAVPMYYSMPQLYYTLQLMNENSGLEIALRGHVCCGNDQPLSEARARAVFDFLVQNGIDSNRLQYRGYSNTEPLVEEISAATEQKNRRVEADVVRAPDKRLENIAQQNKFEVDLLDVPFERNAFTFDGKYNLGVLAGMIKKSRGYSYVIHVYHPDKSTLAREKKALESYFASRGITEQKLTIIIGNDIAKLGQDVLTLSIKQNKK